MMQNDGQLPDGGAQAETWQEEQPPEDTFADETADADPAQESSAAEAQAQRRKRGNMIFMGALAVFTLIIGGLVYMQFFSGSVSSEMQPVQVTEAVDPALAPAVTNLETAAVDAANAALPPGMPAGDSGTTPTVAPSDMAGLVSDSSGVASAWPVPTPTVTPSVPAPQPDASTTIPQPQQIGGQPLVQAPPVAVPTAQAVTGTVAALPMESRMAQIEIQLTTLQQTLDRNAQEIMQLAARMPTADTQAMEQRLGQLQQQLDNLATQRSTVTTTQTTSVVEPKPVARKTTSKPASEPRKARNTQPATSSKWVLRAATPDAAWVSAGAAATDLKRVAVGDSLTGIGRIKEIRQSGNNWQVIGSTGIIR